MIDGALRRLVGVRRRRDGELAVGVPPVHALHPAHGLAASARLPESKELDKAGRESDQRQKVGAYAQQNSPRWAKVAGIRRTIYENSLLIVMGSIWLGTWFAQSVAGRVQYNSDRLGHHMDPVSWLAYIGRPDFWSRTLQNWQSEFLAVGSMAILAVYLRQRGSPESKPVGAPHTSTGVEG